MKRAQLHTGEILEFPPETPDEVVDQTVQEHLNPQPEIDMAAEGLNMLAEALMRILPDTAGDFIEAQKIFVDQRNNSDRESDAEMVLAIQSAAENIVDVLEKENISQAITKNTATLDQIGAKLSHLPEVVRAVNNLSNTIAEVGSALMHLLSKERVIKRSKDGAPQSIVVESKR